WTERLILPGLDVARRPVVEETEPRDVVRGLRDGNRGAERIARPDPDAELELIVEIAARPEGRDCFVRGLSLTVRTTHLRAGYLDGRGAAVIADRHVFVVRQQRVVGPEQLAGVGGVVDTGKEVGVVADGGRKLEAAIGGAAERTRQAAGSGSGIRHAGSPRRPSCVARACA